MNKKIRLIMILFLFAWFSLLIFNLIDGNKIPYLNIYRNYMFLIFGVFDLMILITILKKMQTF